MWQEARVVAKCQSCGRVPELSNLSATCYTGKEPYKCSNPTYSRLASCLSISPLKCLVMATPRRIRILGMRLDLCRIGSEHQWDMMCFLTLFFFPSVFMDQPSRTPNLCNRGVIVLPFPSLNLTTQLLSSLISGNRFWWCLGCGRCLETRQH